MQKLDHKPMVSVIIPTYNRGHLISRAIQGVLNQTYQNFEMIIVDDGSTDNTKEIVGRSGDERIQYIRHGKNKGAAITRNTGIQASQGKYICFLDSDDEWFPLKLEKQVNRFEELNESIGVVYTGCLLKSQNSGKILAEAEPTFRGEVYKDLLKGVFLITSTAMIRRICLQEVGFFDENLPSCEDWDLWIRLSKQYEFDFVAEPLASYYIHGAQMLTNFNARVQALEEFIAKYYLDFSKYPPVLARHLKRMGRWYTLSGNAGKGRKYFWDAIKVYPFMKSTYVHLLISMLPCPIYKSLLGRYYVREVDGHIFYK